MDMDQTEYKRIGDRLESITSIPAFADLKIIDVDTHWSEPHDLWTSRVASNMKNKVPRVVAKGDERFWVVGEDERVLHQASAISVIDKDLNKIYGGDFFSSRIEDVHVAAFDMSQRIAFLDAFGIHTQICYPNVGGVGFSALSNEDIDIKRETVRAYNDAAFEFQAETNNRILPMTVMPFWDVKEALKEMERCQGLGSHGIVIGGDVQNSGVPSLGQRYWDPLWEACEDQQIPINFHIGASEIASVILQKAAWPEFGAESNLAISSASLFTDNGRVMGNLIFSGVPERFPKIKFVSVESGIGWMPFYLEALDYQLVETASNEGASLSMKPSEYFKRNFYATFWFESGMGKGIDQAVEILGADNIMFETDFPHPTCLYPGPLDFLKKSVINLDKETQKKILQDNAAQLYKIDIS